MLESYIRTGDGKDYVDVDCVREALGIKEDENIFLAIKKLKEERERYKSNCDYFAGIAEDKLCDRNKLELELREALGIVDEYVDIPGLVRKLKKERDELKDRCGKLEDRVRTYRIIANGTYGVSCGYSEYSGDKAPCSLRDEPSYTIRRNDSIRVELNLTPTANYKGTIDMEDLKRYIQNYGREKKLGIIESVDYQNAKEARVELAYLYKQVLGKEKLDTDLSPHEIMKAILDEYRRVRIEKLPELVNNCIDELCDKYNVVQPDRSETTRERLDYIFGVLAEHRELANNNFNKAEGFRKEKRAVENVLAELRAKVREIYRSVVDDEWDECLAYTSALNDINEEYKRVVHNFEERTADWSKAQQELDRYRLAVESLLDIPKELRGDISAIERAFTFSKKQYKSLQEFRDNVCDALNMPTTVIDGNIIGRIHMIHDRCDKLARLRSDICTTLCLGCETYDEDILKRVRMTKDCHDALCKDYTKLHDDYIASQKQVKGFTNRCDSLEDLQRDLWELRRNAIEDLKSRGFCFRPEENETLPEIYDKLLKRYDWAYGEYKEQYRLRQCWHVRWESENERANGEHKRAEKLLKEITELKSGEKLLIEFRDAVAKAIGISYPTTNNFILKRVSDIYKERGESHDLAMELDRKCIDLTAKNSDLQQKFDFQSGLRQQWHARYDSEHERANCVQKALDREREKCRVKDISLETAKKQYEKVCGNLETAECALNGMKSKVRSLQEEKTKVISALGQDIWDDCVKEEENNE